MPSVPSVTGFGERVRGWLHREPKPVVPRTILIVDGNASNRQSTARLVESLGYQSVQTHRHRRAIEQLEEQDPDFVLLGFDLDDGNGLDALTQMRELDPDLPIVMLAADLWDARVAEAMRQGAVAYLARPFGAGRPARAVSVGTADRRMDVDAAVWRASRPRCSTPTPTCPPTSATTTKSTAARLWRSQVLVDWEPDPQAGGCLLRPDLLRRLVALHARRSTRRRRCVSHQCPGSHRRRAERRARRRWCAGSAARGASRCAPSCASTADVVSRRPGDVLRWSSAASASPLLRLTADVRRVRPARDSVAAYVARADVIGPSSRV